MAEFAVDFRSRIWRTCWRRKTIRLIWLELGWRRCRRIIAVAKVHLAVSRRQSEIKRSKWHNYASKGIVPNRKSRRRGNCTRGRSPNTKWRYIHWSPRWARLGGNNFSFIVSHLHVFINLVQWKVTRKLYKLNFYSIGVNFYLLKFFLLLKSIWNITQA